MHRHLPLKIELLRNKPFDHLNSHLSGIPTLGKNVVVAGRSKNVGMPIAMLLHTDGRHERPGGGLQCMMGFFSVFFFFLFVCLFFKMVGVNINGINSLIFSCRRCHGHHLSPSHSKGATSPAHSDR